MTDEPNIRAAEVELSCADLDAALAVLGPLGFAVEMVMPADDPAIVVIAGHGLRLRLVRGTRKPPGTIRLACRDPQAIARAPLSAGGIRVELVRDEPELPLPALQPAFVFTPDDPATWHAGRAGMQYRDLIPGRQGGRFVASHIRIPTGGPVPDYVHYHHVRFQMIYCIAGWVRLVYEDQGEPFVMQAGDCVLQPPRIRHRVLESSDALQVVELGCPAIHETRADAAMTLPTPTTRPHRDFDGQRFVWHRAEGQPLAARGLGIATATGGVASARVVTRASAPPCTHDGELLFGFVLRGELTIRCDDRSERARTHDAFTIPRDARLELAEASSDLAWLEVTLPAQLGYARVS
ncbi:MAG TPA: cupin domain-containing protein [Kofleriaceae bacterium]|nr:cupin domain-containing protein [Kofleriaceae bacterium]